MSRNEKGLLGVLAVCLLGWIGLSGWESWIAEPAQRNVKHIDQLNQEISVLEKQLGEVLTAQARVEKFHENSQLGAESDLVYQYQRWLLAHVDKTQLEHVSLSPLPTEKLGDDLVRMPFSFSCRGSREQLMDFLSELQLAAFPHRINTLRMEAVRVGQQTLPGLRLSSELEVVTSLRPTKKVVSLTSHHGSDTEFVHHLNEDLHFAPKVVTPVPRPQPRQPQRRQPPPEPPTTLQLIALVEESGEFQAWFYNLADRKRTIVKANDELGDGHSAAQITQTRVVLSANEQVKMMSLGDRIQIHGLR